LSCRCCRGSNSSMSFYRVHQWRPVMATSACKRCSHKANDTVPVDTVSNIRVGEMRRRSLLRRYTSTYSVYFFHCWASSESGEMHPAAICSHLGPIRCVKISYRDSQKPRERLNRSSSLLLTASPPSSCIPEYSPIE
jgi:hypothetical protein